MASLAQSQRPSLSAKQSESDLPPTTLLHNKRLVVSVCTLAVMLLIFVPLWWRTTGALRTPIPSERIAQLAPKLLSSCLTIKQDQDGVAQQQQQQSHVMKQSGQQVWDWRQELSLVVPLDNDDASNQLAWWDSFVTSWTNSAQVGEWTRVLCSNCSDAARLDTPMPVVSSQVLFHAAGSQSLPAQINSADDISEMLNYNSDTWKFAEIEGVLRVLFIARPVSAGTAQPVTLFGVRDWGAVAFINDPREVTNEHLANVMNRIMQWFLGHEGDGVIGGSGNVGRVDWPRLQAQLTRHHATKAIESLLRLVELLEKMPDILVGEEVSRLLVQRSVDMLEQLSDMPLCDTTGGSGTYAPRQQQLAREAFLLAKEALAHAESAFFHPTMLAMLYFPESQKLAVYLPLVLPVAVTVLIGLLREIRSVRSKRQAAAARASRRTERKQRSQ